MSGNYGNFSLLFGLSTAIGLTLAVKKWYNKNKNNINWKYVGNVTALYMYPIKSCGAIKIQYANCETLGLKSGMFFDRVFMIVDTDGHFQSGRTHPTLVKIKPSILNDNELMLEANGMPLIIINLFDLDNKNKIESSIWEDKIKTVDCGNKAAEWLSTFLLGKDSGLRLVYYPDTKSDRSIRSKFNVSKHMTPDDCGTFVDGSSYMLITQNTLDNLNARLDHKIQSVQFRPNFVIKTTEPFVEDNWNFVRIGGKAVFEALIPCTRCHFINVDPITGESHKDEEPLKTLKSYRQVNDNKQLRAIVDDSPMMGIQMGLREPGLVQIGDPVFVNIS